MIRPLIYKTARELEAAVERNRHDRAELELILTELRHRKTKAARMTEAKAKQYITGNAPAFISRPVAPAQAADPGTYARVHAAATAAGSPVVLGWKYTDAIFAAGKKPHRGIGVHATLQAICQAAGTEGLPASVVATTLRERQIGNTRSQYCDGLPPVGWAEGWIDTAVTQGIIVVANAVRQPVRTDNELTDNELLAAIRRNQHHRIALETIRDELAGRDTASARKLMGLVDTFLVELASTGLSQLKPPVDGAPTAHIETSTRSRPVAFSIEDLSDKAREFWNNPTALGQLRPALQARFGDVDAGHLLARIDARLADLNFTESSSPPTQTTILPESESMTDARRWTEDAVASLRRKLIDLGKKNPLISFKHGGRSASILRIVDERPDLLFGALEAGAVGFEPLPGEDETPQDERTATFRIAYERARLVDEAFLTATDKLGDDEGDAKAWQQAERALRASVRQQLGLPPLDYGKTLDVAALARAHGFDPSFDLKASDADDVAAHHQDDRLRVLLTSKELDKRLKTIWEKYNGHTRETGLHTLFLVLGFVQWSEDTAPDTPLHAPLLLIAVGLERKQVRGRYEYALSGHDEGLQVNVALAEKMRQHWGLELPALREGEEPESYFLRAEAVLAKGRGLSLRRFATLAVLPFPRMVLWKDLDPAAWSEAAFARHRVLPGLLGATQVAGEAVISETLDIDAPEWAKIAPALIRPADASQHSALIDMAAGHDLAIEGPPGTGKSETITNMIATALGAGKRVLFVAEKQAALRVVADRLRAAGFGPLLLELHGDNANRTDVYDGLRMRLKATVRKDTAALASQRVQLDQQRTLLRRYLSLIGDQLGKLGRSAYWLAWREIRLREEFDRAAVDISAQRWQPNDARIVDQAMLADRRAQLDTFGSALTALQDASENGARPRWAEATRLDPFDQRPHRDAAAAAARAAEEMAAASHAFARLPTLVMPAPDQALEEIAEQFDALEPLDQVGEHIARAALRAPDTARALLRQQLRWRQLSTKLEADVADPIAIDDGALTVLQDTLSAVRPLPETVAGARKRLAETKATAILAEESAADFAMLVDRLDLGSSLRVEAMRDAFAALIALDREGAVIQALYRDDLLAPLAEATLQDARDRAEQLRTERETVRAQVSDEAMEVDASALTGIADTLADSGMISRVFGSEYRAAKRRALNLLHAPCDRLGMAELLRETARHHQRRATFKTDSVVAAWFPAVLWKGIDSDWAALATARARLLEVRRSLSLVKADSALDRWLGMTSGERARIGAALTRVLPVFEQGKSLGHHAHPATRLAAILANEAQALAALDTALAGVEARPDGYILRDGHHLAARLDAMRAAAEDFETLATGAHFDWIARIGDPLEPLARVIGQCDALRAIDGPLAIMSTLEVSENPIAALEQIIALAATWTDAEEEWHTASNDLADRTGLIPESFGDTWAEIGSALAALGQDEIGARLAADLLKYSRALEKSGLQALGSLALDGVISPDRLADLYELLLTRSLLNSYLGGDGSELGRIGGLTLSRARQTFARLDKELHELEARAIISSRLDDKPPRGIGHGPKSQHTEMELLSSEIELKRPRTPIRDVVLRAGKALQALKPVWMMSPTSAAQYIRPDSLQFDLLVVDEASQMRPEFALSAILRGQQFVVVGDANQLPPTDHFQTGASQEDEADDASVAQNTESILDLANQRFRRKRRLKWHYRSQHESLIQFSNRQFYDRDLVVFPSPMGNDDDLLGVKCHYVKGAVYEASINQREAEAVIEEAFRLMRAYPQHSIGIAAMNAKQTELIQNEFDRLILEQPEIRRYVNEYQGGIDEFFIKNLENVQGDERDIILISTVYGPGKDGKVAQNFGLMNREVGWRRLNVLVTRAKLSTRLFTSLRPDDVKETASSSRGVRTLKAYLTYAHHGAGYDDATGGEPDSDFEVFVADGLRAAGYEVVHQVGVEGFKIDLGIRHADYPLGFIAGIECDGASFHSGLTVRDRDRIRQSVLENMGWKIYRIWSTDWFADPGRELKKLLEFLETARASYADGYVNRPTEEPVSTQSTKRTDEIVAVISSQPTPDVEDRDQPQGKPQRPLDGIDWYERVKGQLYDIWVEGNFVGEVEVLSRPLAALSLYGTRTGTSARPEYEGRIDRTGETFRTADIYAAVREVARRGVEHP